MACVVIISLTLINIKGVKEGSGVSTFLLIVKISLILFIIVTGLTFRGGNGDPISFVFNGKNFLGALSMGIIACQWAYDGWSSVCIVAEEIKEPQKNIPRAIAIALGSIGFIYLLFNYVLLRLLPVADIVATDNPTYDAVGLMFGKGAATFLTIGIVLSVLGATNSSILAYPREYYVMARDKRVLPDLRESKRKDRHAGQLASHYDGLRLHHLLFLDVRRSRQSNSFGIQRVLYAVCRIAVPPAEEVSGHRASVQGSVVSGPADYHHLCIHRHHDCELRVGSQVDYRIPHPAIRSACVLLLPEILR
jgi:hypothetical protein